MDKAYNDAVRRMYNEVEKRLLNYMPMREELEEFYGEDALIPTVCMDERVKANGKEDRTNMLALRRLNPPSRIEVMQKWVQAIESARDEMLYFAPQLATILINFYCLDKKDGSTKPKRFEYRRLKLMQEFGISQTTFYNKKNTCVEWVKAHALYRGLLDPHMDKGEKL